MPTICTVLPSHCSGLIRLVTTALALTEPRLDQTLTHPPGTGSQVFGLETPGAKLNYGVNKVRFPSPVRVGKRVRAHVSIVDVTDLPAGKQMQLKYVIEIEGEDKPACVAETVVLLLP